MSISALRAGDDRRLAGLIDELRATDPDVARWWADHTVRDHASVAKRIRHPRAGALLLEIETVTAPADPDQRPVVCTAQPDSPMARVLPILASWGTDPVAAGSGPARD